MTNPHANAIEAAKAAADGAAEMVDEYATPRMIEASVTAYLAAMEADGFVMVPVEATGEQIDAAMTCFLGDFSRQGIALSQYAAMIAARPRGEGA